MTQALRMFTDYLWVSSVVSKRISTKGKQRTEKQSLLKVVYQRHLSEAVGRYELIKERL